MITFVSLAGLGIFVLLAEIFHLRKYVVSITTVSLIGILFYTITQVNLEASYFHNMLSINHFSQIFIVFFILLMTFIIALSGEFYHDKSSKITDYVSIKIFLLCGATMMVSFGNLAMFFLGIETLSIALYVLAASDRTNIRSNEAGMKYFLMGAFASSFILFGLAMIYGATGSFDVSVIHKMEKPLVVSWFSVGLALLLVGMFFKLALVPFHFWAPDVYEGSPSLVTMLMATLVKIASIASLFKIIHDMGGFLPPSFDLLIGVVAVASMTVGNLIALRQNNIKRIFAYSGISHAGFMVLVLLNTSQTIYTLYYYAISYALSGVVVFAVIMLVAPNSRESEDIKFLKGLSKNNPILAVTFFIALLSMSGIPIFSGFFAKFFVLKLALDQGLIWVLILGIVNSFLAVGYYFKLIYASFSDSTQNNSFSVPFVYYFVVISSSLINLLIGFYPDIISVL